MRWNWEQQGWPDFVWDASKLASLETQFVHLAGIQQGAFKHAPDADRIPLLIGLMTDEALTTSEIEGEYLNRDSVQLLSELERARMGLSIAPSAKMSKQWHKRIHWLESALAARDSTIARPTSEFLAELNQSATGF